MADWDNFPIVQAAASSSSPPDKGWDAFRPVESTPPPRTFDTLAPGIGPLGIVTAPVGGPLMHLAKPFLPKEWQDYLTGVQRAAFQGATMNFGDEALAGLGSLTGQGTYDDLLARERKSSKEFREENPVGSTVGELHGAISSAAAVPLGPLGRTTIGAAAKGAPFLAQAGRFGARLLERALKGAGVGAAFGYGSGFGEGEGGLEARNAAGVEGAKTGAVLGGVLNAGVPAVASAAGGLLDLGTGAMRALAGPQTQAARQAAAGQVIENIGQKSGKEMLADLAAGQTTAPKVGDVPIPTANIMNNPGLQAATRAELRRDPGQATLLREQRVAGARNALDPLRPDGAPMKTRAALEGEDAARRAALDAAEAEKQAAIREAQDQARAQRFETQEGIRESIGDARTAGQADVEAARAAGAARIQELGTSLEQRIAELRNGGMDALDAAHTAATEALMMSGAVPDKAAASLAARQAIVEELAARKVTGSRLYDAVPEGTRVPLSPLYDVISGIHGEAYRTGRMDALPEVLTSGRIMDFLQNATPQRLEGLRGRLGEDLAKARQGGDRQQARYLQQMIDGIDNTMNAASEHALAGGPSLTGIPELQAARDYWRDNIARPFYRGAVSDILKVGDDGLPRIEPSRTLGAVIKPTARGGTEAIDQFVQAAGGRDNALAAATEWAIGDAAEYAIGRNGRIDLPKLNRWMRERAPVLDALPGLRERLGNARDLAERAESVAADHTVAVQRAQDEGRAAIQQAQQIVAAEVKAAQGRGADAVQDVAARGRAMMQQVEQRAREHVRAVQDAQGANVDAARRSVDEIQKSAAQLYLGTDPLKAAQGIMNSADPALAYLQVADRLKGNHEALAGLKRSIFDALEGELANFATVDTGVRQGTRDLIAANTPMLRAVFGREQADKAVELLRALEASKAHVNIPGNVGSATAEKGTQDSVYDAVLSAVVAHKARHIPLIGPLLSIANEGARNSVRALVKEALFDPEKMRVLLETRVTRENAPSIAKRLSDWTERRMMEGIPVRAMGDAREQERARHARGGRTGLDLGGAPDLSGNVDRFGALMRALRAANTTAGDPYGPAPSLMPASPYPVYYLPPNYSAGVTAADVGSPANPLAAAAGTPASAGVLSPYYDVVSGGGSGPNASSGTGVGSVGPTSDGLAADANAQSVVSIDNNNPTSAAAAQVGRTVIGLLAPTPISIAFAIAHQLAKHIATSGQSNPPGHPSEQQGKNQDPLGNPGVGVGQGVGNTSATGTDNGVNTANPGVSNPGEVAAAPGPPGTTAEGGGPGGGGEGGAPSGTDASGNTFGRGGYARRIRRDDGGRTDADLINRLRALVYRYGAGRNMAPFGQRLGYLPASQNIQDIRAFGPQEDWSQLPPTQDEIANTLWWLNGENERARLGVAGPMYAPETDFNADLGALLNRGW